MYCDILTDNRNRTAPEIRKIFELGDGKLGATGCVAWMFERKGLFLISKENSDEDTLMEIALETEADDVQTTEDKFEIKCDVDTYGDVADALQQAGIEIDMQQLTRIPSTTIDLDATMAKKVLRLMEKLDDHDDVQSVSSNFNISDE